MALPWPKKIYCTGLSKNVKTLLKERVQFPRSLIQTLPYIPHGEGVSPSNHQTIKGEAGRDGFMHRRRSLSSIRDWTKKTPTPRRSYERLLVHTQDNTYPIRTIHKASIFGTTPFRRRTKSTHSLTHAHIHADLDNLENINEARREAQGTQALRTVQVKRM